MSFSRLLKRARRHAEAFPSGLPLSVTLHQADYLRNCLRYYLRRLAFVSGVIDSRDEIIIGLAALDILIGKGSPRVRLRSQLLPLVFGQARIGRSVEIIAD